jgi:hypothetical protein
MQIYLSRVCALVCHEVLYQMPLKNQVLPHQCACFGHMIVVDRLKSQSVVSHKKACSLTRPSWNQEFHRELSLDPYYFYATSMTCQSV